MANEDSYISQLMEGAKNPAAPSGLQQTARAGAGAASKDPAYADSYIGQLIGGDPAASMAGDAAQSWYGGTNVEGTTNGWDTDFMATAFRQQEAYTEKAYAERDATLFYDWLDPVKNPTATGVATWNDDRRGIKAGDVYENGQKVGNLYDQFDEYTADVMLAEFKLDAKSKQQIFSDDNRVARMREEVQGFIDADTDTLTNTLTQKDFSEGVEEREDKLRAGLGDEALMTGSAAGGAVLGGGIGATAGSIIPGAGTLVGGAIGAGIGALVGGIGGWLNQDQLVEQTARAQEIVDRANSRYGGVAPWSTRLEQYSGVALKMIAPASNITQGLYDALAEGGRLGDGRSEFYEMDEDGKRKRPMMVQVADIAATVVDSVAQFSSGAGIAAYMGATGTHVLGKVGTMASTGAGFNDRTGDFDDYEGGKEWATAIGAVAIDAVQFGMAGAIAKAGAAGRAAVTGNNAGRPVTLNGRTFWLDDAGQATKSRFNVSLLAPSESLRWVATSWRARMRREVGSGTPSHDDFYRAALSMAGGNRFSNALVNGWAEGSEEAAQAIFEPMSFSADVEWGHVFEAYAYGMAAGVGMSMGQVSRPPTNNAVASYRAKALYMKRNSLADMSDEEWSGIWGRMSPAQQERAAVATPQEATEIAETMQMFEDLHTIDRSRKSTIGAMAEQDLRKNAMQRDLANANPSVDGSLVLMGVGNEFIYENGKIESDLFAPNAGVTTAWRAVANVAQIYRGLEVQATDVKQRKADATAELAAATESGDADQIERAQQKLDRINVEAADTAGLLKVSDMIRNRLLEMYEVFHATTVRADAEALIDEMNEYLRDAFHGQLKDENGTVLDGRIQEFARRSVELRVGRHPFIDSGSFQILMPQISKVLTDSDNAPHGSVYTHQATLKAIAGDHDGDFVVSLNTAYLPQAQLDALRMGAQYLKATEAGKEVIVDPPDGEKTFIDMIADGYEMAAGDPLNTAAIGEMTDLTIDFYERYIGVVPDQVLIKALDDFQINVALRDYDARLTLANTLFNAAEQPLLRLGKDSGTPELLWMMARINRSWDTYQKTVSAHDADMEFTPATVNARMPRDRAFQVELAAREASTDGQTIAMLLPGADPVRDSQHLHYSSLYRAAVETLGLEEGGYVTEAVQELVELFANLGSQMTQSELDSIRGRNSIEKRVVFWLRKISEAAKAGLPPGTTPSDALLLIANTRVADVQIHGPNDYTVVDGEISMLQLLLKKSLEIEENAQRDGDPNSDIAKKIKSLKRLVVRDAEGHSTTASLATMEVFGHLQLHELLGDSSKYLGPQLTLNQLKATLANVTEYERNKIVYRWRRRAPYAMHAKMGDPPYSAAAAASGQISSYKILVDAVTAAAHRAPTRLERKNDAAEADLVNGLAWVRQMVTSHRQMHSERLGEETGDIEVLRDMLEKNLQLAESIAAIIPDAAKAGAFELSNGGVYAAPWVEQMLIEPDAGKAAVSYIVNSRFAEWNALGGNVDEKDIDPETGDFKPNKHPRSYKMLKSRFLQTMYHLALEADGFEFNRFILEARSAASPAALYEQINNEPMWLQGRAKMLPFVDDVAEYEADPSEIWASNLPGALQREALKTFAGRAEIMSRTMAEQATRFKTEKVLLNDIEKFLAGGKNRRNAKKYAGLLDLAIKNRVRFPDANGRAAREQLMAILQSGVIRMQDKGKADPAVAPFGEPLITMDEFGVKQAVFQELDALTSLDPEDIRTNLTKLVDGPVRIGLGREHGGATVLVDLSTVEGAVAALKDPATNAFAKAVLFPTVRDINDNNVVQSYQDVRGPGLKTMLEEQTFKHLFSESGKPSVEQAYRYIGTVEAGVRKAALTGTDAERDKAFFPIQQIINEALVAYSHLPGAETKDKQKVRDELIVDVAYALMTMAALPSRNQLEQVRATIKASLRERFLRDSSALAQLLDNNFESAVVDIQLTDATAASYQRAAAKITAQLEDPNLTPVEQQALQDQLKALGDKVREFLNRLDPLKTDDVVMSVVNMFTMTGDLAADLERMAAIQRILGAANRLGRFQGNYRLIDKVQALVSYDPLNTITEEKISREEWDELAAWASTVYLAEMGGRAGSSVTLTPLILGKDGEQQRRYFDVTWGYLIDGLLDEQLLEQARAVAAQAGYAHDMKPDQVAGVLEQGLLNEKKLGKWTPMVVPESLKARRVLSTASVGLAVPVAGDDPKELADYVGAGWNLFEKPDPAAHHTTEVFAIDADGVLDAPPLKSLKLENHFAARVRLKGVNSMGDYDLDLMPEVGQAWMGEESVENSGYLVISAARIAKAFAKMREVHDLGADPVVEIEYVDVDKKPYTRAYANSVYFDGIGRDSAASVGPGPVAELAFAPGALSKTGQQNPLDMATKGGAAYRAIPTSPLDTTIRLEGSSANVAEVLGAKALHMLGKEYDTGYLLPADITALYKLMKQRHVVVGTNAAGEKEVWWAERAIAAQAAGEPLLTDAKLVALSDSQAQTLLGKAGTKGLRGVATMPMFNLADVDPFPSTDMARLKSLGLDRLGEEGTLADSPFAGMAPLPLSSWSPERGQSGRTRYQEKVERWRGEQLRIRSIRSQVSGVGPTKFEIPRINDEAGKALQRMLGQEALAPIFARLKIPFPELRDMAGLEVSQRLLAKLREAVKANPSSVIWQHIQDASSDPVNGVLGSVALDNDFANLGEIPPPTFEDFVIIDMAAMERASGGVPEEAYRQAKAVIRQYAQRGVTVVLAAEDGGHELRNDLTAWLREESLGYRQMAESPHFFAPINDDYRTSQTQEALESTLTMVQQVQPRGLVARVLSDRFGTASSENMVFQDLRDDTPVMQRVAITLMPTQITGTAGGRKYTYGIPVAGVGQLDQRGQVKAALLPLLRSEEGRKHLKRISGGDPKDAKIYRENSNGTIDPGILSFDEALDELQNYLESNQWMLEPGRTLMIGSFIPTIGTDGSILLVRAGFKLPDVVKLGEQLSTPTSENGLPAKVGIAVGELQANWTVPPPFTIDSIEADAKVGIAIEGTYDLNTLGKEVLNGDGFKSGLTPMPNHLAFPDEPLAANGIRVTQAGSRKAVESKAAVTGQLTNFRWAFLLSGIDFREDMVNFFLGSKQRTEEEFLNDWAVVGTFLEEWTRRKPGVPASEIADMLDAGTFLAYARVELNAIGAEVFGDGYTVKGTATPFDKQTDPTERLATVLLAALMAPRVKLEHVIATPGLMTVEDRDGEMDLTLMPQIFTDALNDTNYPELRNMLFDRVNARMPREDDGTPIYWLGRNWEFRIRMQNPETGKAELMPTTLQISLGLPAAENPAGYVQSSVRSERQGETQHVSFVFAETAGGRIALERPMRNVNRLFSSEGIARFGDPEDGGFWSLLNAVPSVENDSSYAPWRRLLPMQLLYLQDAGRKVGQYLQEVDKTDSSVWKKPDVARANALVDQLLTELNLGKLGEAARVEVDYLVRQFFGIPGASPEQAPEIGAVSPQVYTQAVELMLENVRKNRVPTYGGIVPLPHETFLAMVFEEQRAAANPWAPAIRDGRKTELAQSWEQWVGAAFGQMLDSNEEFHGMFRTDLDGFMHTYQGTADGFETMALSTDQQRDLKLMDKAVNENLLSLDPNMEVLLADPVLFETQQMSLAALTGHEPTVDNASARHVPTSDLAKQIERQTDWLRGKKLAPQQKTRMKDYLDQGVRYQESSRDTHAFFHGMVNLSITMRLANPALFASAFLEVPVRNAMEHATNLLTGSYTGKGAKTISKIGRATGMETRFSPEQIDMFNALAEQMGESNRWLATVYDELMYQNLVEAGRGTLGGFLEKTASISARATSDPRWGMLAKSIAKRYLEAAWEFISISDNPITFEQFIAEMTTDPTWLERNVRDDVFNPHQAGLNRVAQVRSVKGTVTSKILMGWIDSWTRSSHSSLNATGHLLKIPFLFTRFNANALTTMTGMGGFDQLAAMFLDRRENALLGRIKAGMLGREYNPAEHDAINMSDVLEGIDLTRPFIRGAVTHTGLMAMGMMAGGLGLSGEDEEARRRRRLATYLGTPLFLDPREAQNDFLYADAIFLDSIPGLNMLFRDESGRSAVVPHWIIRQFTSPVMGMERFFSTGDVRQIGWGFADAFSVIPTSVTRLWREADMTADLLAEAAKEDGSIATPEQRSKVSQLLINVAGVYEKALLESSFVNSIRNGADKYNRNPWFLPETKDDGTIVRDRMGNPQRTQALSTFRDEDGNVAQGYTNRDSTDAMVHQYTENNATAAILMSLFTGQWSSNSSYLRQNMTPSQKIVNLGPADKAKAEALLLSAYVGKGGQPQLTLDEIERTLKARDEAAGKWWDQEEITAEAQRIYERNSGELGALSLLDAEGREVITKDGARGVFRSLEKGLIELGHPSLRGVYIPPEMRDEIAAEWAEELVQEGVDLGLSETAAKYRAKRLWYGSTFEDPNATGLRDILYSDKIPYNGKVVYNQLNTTYMIGPDGKPWATPFQRANVMQSLGIPWPHTTHTSGQGGLGKDERGKVVDEVVGINTGLHALERVEESWKIEPNDEPFEDAVAKTFTPDGAEDGEGGKYTPWKKWGYTPWKRSYGGGGYGGSYGGGGFFSRMYALPRATAPYSNQISFINTSNPYVRRAFVRRERVWSERGRLKQWQ